MLCTFQWYNSRAYLIVDGRSPCFNNSDQDEGGEGGKENAPSCSQFQPRGGKEKEYGKCHEAGGEDSLGSGHTSTGAWKINYFFKIIFIPIETSKMQA